MIVVVGSPLLSSPPSGPGGAATGRPVLIAAAATAAGATAELVGRVGEDPGGDAVLLALARTGVGHKAILRDTRPTPAAAVPDDPNEESLGLDEDDDGQMTEPAGIPLDAADVQLGLEYLGDFGVLVAAEPADAAMARVLADAAAFNGAALVAVVAAGAPVPAPFAAATVLEAPASDPEGAFGALVGRFAAALDRGVVPAAAFRAATADGGWQAAEDEG